MTTNIQLLRSAIASKRPVAANLLDGQAAINTNATEPGLFFKLTDNNLVKIGPVALSSDGNAPNSAPAGSSGNSLGETWLDTRLEFGGQSVLKVFNGANWVPGNGFNVDDATGEFELDNVLTVEALIGDGTGDNSHVTLPRDTTANRPSTPVEGMFRYNTTDRKFEGYGNGSWVRFANLDGDGSFDDLTATGDVVLGNNCGVDTLTVNAVATFNCNTTIGANNTQSLIVNSRINSSLVPSADITRTLGSSTLRWADVHTFNLNAAGNVILGDSSTDLLGINSRIISSLIPSSNASFALGTSSLRWSDLFVVSINTTGDFLPSNNGTQDLGSSTLRWADLYVNNIDASGNVTLGDDASTDTLTVNSRIASSLVPSADIAWTLGSPTLRWADVHIFNLSAAGNVILGDATSDNLSINSRTTAFGSVVLSGTEEDSHLTLPRDTTTNRPSTGVNGMVRYNTTDNVFEGYEDGEWVRFLNLGPNGSSDDLALFINQNTTLYVTTGGNDTTGDGSVSSPWATPQRAAEYLSQRRIKSGVVVTVSIGAGTYTFTSALRLSHPQGSQIVYVGATPTGTRPTGTALNGNNGAAAIRGYTAATQTANNNALNAHFNTIFQFNSTTGIAVDPDSTLALQNILIRGNYAFSPNPESPYDGILVQAGLTGGIGGGVLQLNNAAIHNFGGRGLALVSGGNAKLDGVTITNCLGGCSNSSGIILGDVAGGLTISNCNGDGINIIRNGTARIKDSYISNNGRDGLTCTENSSARANNSVISNNGRRGVTCRENSSIQVIAATVTDNGNVGLRAAQAGFIDFGNSNNASSVLSGNGSPAEPMLNTLGNSGSFIAANLNAP